MEVKDLIILPAAKQSSKTNYFAELYNHQQAEGITKTGRSIMEKIIVSAKEHGFDCVILETNHELIGDTVFPVTYGPNGLIMIDYP